MYTGSSLCLPMCVYMCVHVRNMDSIKFMRAHGHIHVRTTQVYSLRRFKPVFAHVRIHVRTYTYVICTESSLYVHRGAYYAGVAQVLACVCTPEHTCMRARVLVVHRFKLVCVCTGTYMCVRI